MRRTKRVGVIVSVVVCLFSLLIIYGFWNSKNNVVVRNETFESSKIDSSLRILFLSDLHDFWSSSFMNRLKNETEQQKLDLVVMGGDMVNSATTNFSTVMNLIDELPAEVPVIYVPGNEELDNPGLNHFIAELEKKNVHYLDQDYMDISLQNQEVRIGGLYDYSFALDGNASPDPKETNPQVSEFLSDFQETSALKIMVHHRPDSFVFSSQPDYWKIDFSMAGHAHGGQVVFPFVGGLWAPDQGWFPEYVHGKYRLGKLTTFITSGISTGNEIIPRFNNPMEIMIININPKESS